MDPTVTHKQILSLIEQAEKTDNPFHVNDLYREACDGFVTLNEWLTNGGFPPADWISCYK